MYSPRAVLQFAIIKFLGNSVYRLCYFQFTEKLVPINLDFHCTGLGYGTVKYPQHWHFTVRFILTSPLVLRQSFTITVCKTQKGQMPFPKDRDLEAKVLPSQHHCICYFVSFLRYITGAKFQLHNLLQ